MKIISFLTLFIYINTVTHYGEHGHPDAENLNIEGDTTLVEYVLEELMDIPAQDEGEDPEVHYDDYRYANIFDVIIPVPVKELQKQNLIPGRQLKAIHADFINTKLRCIPGYYSFLFRLKPF